MKKLNESFTFVENLTTEQLQKLTIKKDIRFNVWAQMNPKYAYEYFYKPYEGGFVIPNGILEYLELESKPLKSEKLNSQLNQIIKILQPFEIYDYQLEAIKDSIQYKKLFIQAATGAGKSVIVGLIAKILTLMKLKGLILVPNITLTNQFDNDLKSYNLNIGTRLIGGGNNIKSFDRPLTISTWQSVKNFKNCLDQLDFIIVDEAHTAKSDQIFDICNKCINASYKIGLTGTTPKSDIDKLRIISVFGVPKVYITPRGLIDRGLATNAQVNLIRLKYNKEFESQVNSINEYSSQLKKIKECSPRTSLIAKITNKVSENGNTLVLFQHTEHGLKILYNILKLRNLDFDNKTYKDLLFQKINKIFFINGLIEGGQREAIRKTLEEVDNAIIVANYATMSTGTNIKNLHNLILASPLKSYITITQSIGRLLRTHKSKRLVRIYDIVDELGFFKRQIKERLNESYNPEGYEIKEFIYNI